MASSRSAGSEIAVIGMAGRFPGAANVDAFWDNLRRGVESVSEISLEEWAAATAVHTSFIDRPNLVRYRPRIDGIEMFDAAFFGYTPREAQILDPQHRLFLECAWEALEEAGYDSERFPGAMSIMAGVSLSTYLLQYVQWDRELGQAMGNLKIGLGNMCDALATRVAYKLNLRGAAFAVQSFCSTSLVAVHLACQGLLNRESDVAMAGGVTISVPQETGYQYQEGGILAPDGRTRTFDARGGGMVFGNGLGIVVLKRLADAIRDGDNVRAVILGSAINNDGALKVGFTAPSVAGQAQVIVEALAAADVDPETISYVEAHGTATALGDPAEVAGLTKAWRRWTQDKQYCAIGSVKTNIGHLDAAAGVTGLIKSVLCLENGEIPPSLHYESPNPQIDFATSPFFVNTKLRPWERNGAPRRAAVSSFGIGGTNAHAILEEAPPLPPTDPARPWQLLLVTAKTETAAIQSARNLAGHLAARPDSNLADVAWTLQVGRRVFNHRRFVVARDAEDAREALVDPARLEGGIGDRQGAPVAFLFTGQGSQYVGMGRGLYEDERVFREALDACAEALEAPLGLDLRELLFAAPAQADAAAERLTETRFTQPALFAVEYALARLWMSWGLKPAAMLGHSVGEYVAAHLASVFSLEDALALVAERGRLMQSVERGSMLAVSQAEEALRRHLPSDLDLASVNAPGACVVSGPTAAVERFEAELLSRGVSTRKLHTSHAFHSAMMEPILAAFTERVLAVALQPPSLPFVSNVTGRFITEAEATDPGYWARHLRAAVRFSDGLRTLRDSGDPVLLEVGPGNTLATLARQHTEGGAPVAVPSLRHPKDAASDRAFLLGALGRLWAAGVTIDWTLVHAGETRRRVRLPTYPFERQAYWVDANEDSREADAYVRGFSLRRQDVQDWFYQVSWRRYLPAEMMRDLPAPEPNNAWLVFADAFGLGDEITRTLRGAGHRVAVVRPGDRFAEGDDGFRIGPGERADYVALLATLAREGRLPTNVVHLWGLGAPDGDVLARLPHSQERGFFSLLFLAQALSRAEVKHAVQMAVVTDGMQEVVGGELTCPEKATVIGPCKVIPQEFPNVFPRSIDIERPSGTDWPADTGRWLVAELLTLQTDAIVAYRGRHRWVQTAEPMALPPVDGRSALRSGGVYLITGGLGGVGLALARHLAARYHARLVLTGRAPVPERDAWDGWLGSHPEDDPTSLRIRSLRGLEEAGAEVLYAAADVTRPADMQAVVRSGRERFGRIEGVVHAAGVPGGGIIPVKEADGARRVMSPKLEGTLVLEAALRDDPPDFLVLCSSIAAIMGGFGQIDYCGANAFLDAYAHRARAAGRPLVQSINWDAWRDAGMAVNTPVSGAMRAMRDIHLKIGISNAEGVDAFERALSSGLPQVAVFTMDLLPSLVRRRKKRKKEPEKGDGAADGAAAAEPPVSGLTGDIERGIAAVWEAVLGRKNISVNDNFFELGGDSLTALQVIAMLKSRLGKDVPVVTFYEAPTVGLLAKALGQRAGGEAPATLEDVGQRAETRLDLMRRRRQRTGAAVSGSR